MLPLAFGAGTAAALRGGGYVLGQWVLLALGACFLGALTAMLVGRKRSPGSTTARAVPLPAPVRIAIAGVVGYCVWSMLGIAWASDRFAAHEEAARTAWYGGMLLLAGTITRTRGQVEWAIAAWVGFACIVSCATLWRLTDMSSVVFQDGRLLGTLGYPNGWAAVLLAPVPPALAMGCSRSRHPAVRACLVGSATLLVLVATMSQSRGALVALAFGLVCTVAVAPNRSRMLASIALVGVVVGAAWPRLSEVYRVRPRTPPAVREMIIADARLAVLACAFAALVLTAVVALLDERVAPSPRVRHRLAATTGIVLAVAVVAGGVTFARNDLLAGRLDSISDRSTSARVELWRVGALDVARHPVGGVGPGNVDATIYQHRERVHPRTPRQLHQLTLENLAERGIIGTALLLASIAAITAVAWRARSATGDDETRMLVAGLVGACAGWLLHAQVDWIWHLSAVTVPISLVAGCLLAAGTWCSNRRYPLAAVDRRVALAVLGAAIALLVPLAVADRSMTDTRRSLDSGRIAVAGETARAATTWAPHSPRAWQLRAQAHAALGNEAQASRAYAMSQRRSPDHWRTHATAASYYARTGQGRRARKAREDAARLDPLGYGAGVARPGRDPATR